MKAYRVEHVYTKSANDRFDQKIGAKSYSKYFTSLKKAKEYCYNKFKGDTSIAKINDDGLFSVMPVSYDESAHENTRLIGVPRFINVIEIN